jgi:PAS domain S-box-containing protein
MKGLASNPEERPLFRELVEQIFSQLPAALYALIFLSALQVFVLWRYYPRWILLSWLAMIWAVTLARFVLYYCFGKYSGQYLTLNRWQSLFSLGVILTGICWGLTPILFFSDASPQTNVFIAFVIGGLVAGAASSLAGLKVTMRIFTLLLCAPLITRFIAAGDSLHVVMGIMLFLYGGAYLVLSANTGRMVVTSLRLRHENSREIEARKQMEIELRLIQEELERTVETRTGQLKTANEELTRQISERLQAELNLMESEERYRSLVESSSDWIWEVDRDGLYTYSSPSVESILGYTVADVLGRTFYDFMPPDEAGQTRTTFERNKLIGKPIVGLVNRCRHKNGSEVVLETNGEPIFDDAGTLTGYRGIDRDISVRVRHEKETRKVEHLHSLGLLAGGIAHDFNNLLTAVFGNIELARMELRKASPGAQALDDSAAAMEQARMLTGQLLTFSKGGSPVMETTSIRELLLDTCRFTLSGSALRCVYDVPEDLRMADVDPGQIWQVLNHVLTNAREAMPKGGTIRAAAENVDVDDRSSVSLPVGQYVRISVTDEGEGISRSNLPRVFDPYFSTKVRGPEKGTGIGLAVCHSIIEKHRGLITLESAPGEGTTVAFYLPALGELAQDTDAEIDAAEGRTPGCRVLLLEDDESVITTTSRILQHLGHSVEVARHGAEAVECYDRFRHQGVPFDLVLLDLTIRGGMGGQAAIEKIREIDPGVVAVVASGYADDPVMSNCKQYGFDASLIKPFSIRTLRGLIEDLVRPAMPGNGLKTPAEAR